jgi:hypothetical protein
MVINATLNKLYGNWSTDLPQRVGGYVLIAIGKTWKNPLLSSVELWRVAHIVYIDESQKITASIYPQK